MDTQEIEKKTWDVVIIGTGMGGATIGYELARAGLEVLFCEQGGDYLTSPAALKGEFPEAIARSEHTDIHDRLLQRAGRWDERLLDATMDMPSDFRPLLGSGTGGSSALYGMVFERFFPGDFNPKESFPHAHDANLPENWPVTYSDLAPYYIAAEALYRVRATHDPLRPVNEERAVLSPPPLSPANEELFDLFQAKGLHPYYLPMACEYKPGCQECLGILCPQCCKNDSATICLEPAVNSFGATLLTHCRADYIDASQTAVHSVVCTWKQRKIRVSGQIILVAAGAIGTPALFLRSASAIWPSGLANHSDQVGRNLMRHFLDYYLTYPLHSLTSDNLVKQIALNDFYFIDDGKLGTLQSNGPLPPAAYVSQGMRDKIQQKFMPFGALFHSRGLSLRQGIGSLRKARWFLHQSLKICLMLRTASP